MIEVLNAIPSSARTLREIDITGGEYSEEELGPRPVLPRLPNLAILRMRGKNTAGVAYMLSLFENSPHLPVLHLYKHRDKTLPLLKKSFPHLHTLVLDSDSTARPAVVSLGNMFRNHLTVLTVAGQRLEVERDTIAQEKKSDAGKASTDIAPTTKTDDESREALNSMAGDLARESFVSLEAALEHVKLFPQAEYSRRESINNGSGSPIRRLVSFPEKAIESDCLAVCLAVALETDSPSLLNKGTGKKGNINVEPAQIAVDCGQGCTSMCLIAFARAIERNPHLLNFQLIYRRGKSNISKQAVPALCDALKANTTLYKLDLRLEPFKAEDILNIARTCCTSGNDNLKRLYLMRPSVIADAKDAPFQATNLHGKEHTNEWVTLLKANTSLQSVATEAFAKTRAIEQLLKKKREQGFALFFYPDAAEMGKIVGPVWSSSTGQKIVKRCVSLRVLESTHFL